MHARAARSHDDAVAAVARTLWERVRWTVTTTLVAGGAFSMGIVALWTASFVAHSSLAATADRWDGSWYYRISQLGYVSALPRTASQVAALRPAFFPGLPLVERAVHAAVGGPPAATILLVGAAGLVASCLLVRAFVALVFGEEAAWRATVLFAFFPGAYVFVFGYSELLEIPLAVLALYALRRRWYLLAGIATAAATGTRLLGIALVASLVVAAGREMVRARRAERPEWPHLVASALSPLIGISGLAGYMAYLHERTGSFLAFETAERVGWHNSVSVAEPFDALRAFVRQPLGAPWVTVDAAGVVVVVACLVFLVVGGWRRLDAEEAVYAAAVLLAWLFTSNTGAWFRFVLSAFPVVALLGARLGWRSSAVLACAGAALLGILVVLFGSAVAFSP